jgi:hypothetical protein
MLLADMGMLTQATAYANDAKQLAILSNKQNVPTGPGKSAKGQSHPPSDQSNSVPPMNRKIVFVVDEFLDRLKGLQGMS